MNIFEWMKRDEIYLLVLNNVEFLQVISQTRGYQYR